MRNPLSDKVVALEPSGIRKFFDIVSEMKDAISLGVGEPDFDTPWHIREEGIYSLERGRTFYTSNSGLMELRQEICNYLKRSIHVAYSPKEVLITVGGSEAIDLAMRAMLNPGEDPEHGSKNVCHLVGRTQRANASRLISRTSTQACVHCPNARGARNDVDREKQARCDFTRSAC